MNKLRILVILPFYGGSLPIGQYVATALRDLSHHVEIFAAPDFYSAFCALKNLRLPSNQFEVLESSFLQVISQAIRAKADLFEPDLVFCLAQAPVTRNLLRTFRKNNITTAMWFVEDFRVFPYWRAFAPLYDFFFVIQKSPLLDELAKMGVQATYLPLAALPSFHKQIHLSPAERRRYGSSLSFLGAGYPNRRLAFRQLTHFDFKIWGSDWDDDAILTPFLQQKGERISPEQAVKIFNASIINLNLHSSIQSKELIPPGDFVNPRTFELACCGAFQLLDQRSLLPELFHEDELATFTSMSELLDKIAYYLKHPEERQVLAEKARSRVLAEHTYQHRMQTMLDFIQARTPNFPKPRATFSLPEDLPENLRHDLIDLFQNLELPAHATFEDVILRLRQKSGVLTPLETSLLFLDEWRKQYRK